MKGTGVRYGRDNRIIDAIQSAATAMKGGKA
jgi:hypothetical protein